MLEVGSVKLISMSDSPLSFRTVESAEIFWGDFMKRQNGGGLRSDDLHKDLNVFFGYLWSKYTIFHFNHTIQYPDFISMA